MSLAVRNKELIEKFFESLKAEVIEEQKRQGRVASGKSLSEWEIQINEFRGVLLGSRYAGTLETGRKPGKVPKGFAEIIEDWMRDKGIFQTKTIAERGAIASAIAWRIHKEGTKLHRTGGNSGVIIKFINDKRINEFAETLSGAMENEITQEILPRFGKVV